MAKQSLVGEQRVPPQLEDGFFLVLVHTSAAKSLALFITSLGLFGVGSLIDVILACYDPGGAADRQNHQNSNPHNDVGQ